MRVQALTHSRQRATDWGVALPVLLIFLGVGALGVYRYVDNYWLYRGYAPPRDPAFVRVHGQQETVTVKSPALGGRSQQVLVYLPPGYSANPSRRYPVIYLLHGFPGRPSAFLLTVRMGMWMDALTAQHRIGGAILVMPFGSTGTFEDKEWANGIRHGEGWETFVARDVVGAVDRRYRTIPTELWTCDCRALRGWVRSAQHWASPPRRVRRHRELVGIHARRQHPRDLRRPARAARLQQPGCLPAPRRKDPASKRYVTSGSTPACATRCWPRTARSPPSSAGIASRTAFSSTPEVTPGRSGVRTHAGR